MDRPWDQGINDRVRYDRAGKRWLSWNGQRWLDDEAPAYRMLVDRAEKMMSQPSTAPEARADLMKLLNVPKQESVMKALSRREGIRLNGDEFDQNPFLMGVPNGVLNLETGELSARGNPTDYITKSTSPRYPYDPEAPTPTLFLKFLKEVMSNDDEMAGYLLSILGYAMLGYQREQMFWMLVGGGQNGKGTLVRVLHDILGDYAAFASPALYMKNRFGDAPSSAPRADLMALQGKRFMPTSEPVGGAFNDTVLKGHTGDDPIRARALHSNREIEFRPTHTLFFLTNDPPTTDDVGVSMRRRARIIRFDEDFTNRRDPDMEANLKKEGAGILRLLAVAAKHYLEHGLAEPAKVTAWSEEYIAENDPLVSFLADTCIIDRHSKVQAKIFYEAYHDWAIREDLKPITATGFGLAIVRHNGIKKRKEREGTFYYGVRPKHAGEVADDDE